MYHYLKPSHVDNLAKAALDLCFPQMDDVEDLKSPSKMKYDLQRMTNIKWAYLLKNKGSGAEMKECKDLRWIEIEWSEKVTRIAKSVIFERKLLNTKEIPSPEDVKAMNEYVIEEISKTESEASREVFKKVSCLVQTRLLMYNKRRSGEIDAIRYVDIIMN